MIIIFQGDGGDCSGFLSRTAKIVTPPALVYNYLRKMISCCIESNADWILHLNIRSILLPLFSLSPFAVIIPKYLPGFFLKCFLVLVILWLSLVHTASPLGSDPVFLVSITSGLENKYGVHGNPKSGRQQQLSFSLTHSNLSLTEVVF